MYAVPEYGGNANLVGWSDIKFPGDSQPRGYTNAEVEAPEWNVVGTSGIIDVLLQRRLATGHRQDGRNGRRKCRPLRRSSSARAPAGR